METKAVHRYLASLSLRSALVLALAAVAGLALLAAPASAKRRTLVGHDGKIHGCYRVKVKPKGMLRVVRARHYHCRRGERKVAWSAAATAGPSGVNGQDGQAGTTEATTTTSTTTTSKEAALESEIAGLTTKVENLEGLVEGLVGEVGAANGLLGEVCSQTQALTGVTNELGAEFQNLLTTLTGTLLGAIFGGIEVPAALDETLTCPS